MPFAATAGDPGKSVDFEGGAIIMRIIIKF